MPGGVNNGEWGKTSQPSVSNVSRLVWRHVVLRCYAGKLPFHVFWRIQVVYVAIQGSTELLVLYKAEHYYSYQVVRVHSTQYLSDPTICKALPWNNEYAYFEQNGAIDCKTFKLVYSSMIRSNLEYGVKVWNP